MTLSPEILANIREAEKIGLSELHLQPPEITREAMKHFPKIQQPTRVGKIFNVTIPGLNIIVRIYLPSGQGPFPCISFFHGGGFVLMSVETHDELCRQLCAKSDCLVMSVDYKLAPEHPYPQGPESCVAATKWLIENAHLFNGIGTSIAVAGDSAGGYMAIYVARILTAQHIGLKAQFAAYPVTDHYSSHHPSWIQNGEGYVLTAAMMKWFWDNYLTDPSKFDEASPLRSKDFNSLPPALIITANYDPLRDEGRAYAEKLSRAGVATIYRNYENIHGFLGTGNMGQEALELASHFLKEKLYSEQYESNTI